MEKGHYRKYAHIGPGGWKCACCAPAPGKAKRDFKRLMKRIERAIAKRELERNDNA